MSVGKATPLASESIDVGRADESSAVAAGVAEAKIVGVDENDIGQGSRSDACKLVNMECGKEEKEVYDEVSHGGVMGRDPRS